MKALVLNAVGRRFDFEDVDIAVPIGREVLVESGWQTGGGGRREHGEHFGGFYR